MKILSKDPTLIFSPRPPTKPQGLVVGTRGGTIEARLDLL
jgi:hypothetical protein